MNRLALWLSLGVGKPDAETVPPGMAAERTCPRRFSGPTSHDAVDATRQLSDRTQLAGRPERLRERFRARYQARYSSNSSRSSSVRLLNNAVPTVVAASDVDSPGTR